MRAERRQPSQRFEIRLCAFARFVFERQLAVQYAYEFARRGSIHVEHAQVHLVISDHVNRLAEEHEAASGADMGESSPL